MAYLQSSAVSDDDEYIPATFDYITHNYIKYYACLTLMRCWEQEHYSLHEGNDYGHHVFDLGVTRKGFLATMFWNNFFFCFVFKNKR